MLICPFFCKMNKSRKPKRTDPLLAEFVAQRLRQLRNDNNWTQEFVQVKTNLNIPRVEAGELQVSLVSLNILCEFYNISISEFFKDFELK